MSEEKSKEYQEGYKQGVKDIAERIKKYYRCLGSMTNPCIMEYYIDQITKEMTEGG
jgi:hypothetical protein